MLRFFYNGIKTVNDKKLQKVFYSEYDNGAICVTCDSYIGFSPEICQMFDIIDNTDMMTDYFERPRFTVSPNSTFYNAAKIAMLQSSLKHFTNQMVRYQKRGYSAQVEELQLKIDECKTKIARLK